MNINDYFNSKFNFLKRPAKTPMSEIIDLWLENKQHDVKKSTFEYYKRICNNIIKKNWIKYNSRTIHEGIMQDLIDNIREDYSPKSLKDISIIGNQILNFAFEQGLTKINASKRIRIPYKRTAPNVFSSSEQQRLTDFLLKDIDTVKAGVLISLYTGIRLGELCGLQWGDIDLDRRMMKIQRTIQKIKQNFIIDSPKTVNSERIVPIPSFLYEVLCKFKADKTCYVATGTTDFMQPRTYQNKFKCYLKACGIPDYCFHTLRHTFASRAIELGFDPKSLSEILGHSNVKITLDLYVHPSMEMKLKQMELFSKFL